jgi:hypothetical protein
VGIECQIYDTTSEALRCTPVVHCVGVEYSVLDATLSPDNLARVIDSLRCMTDALDAVRSVNESDLIGGLRPVGGTRVNLRVRPSPKNLEVACPSTLTRKA